MVENYFYWTKFGIYKEQVLSFTFLKWSVKRPNQPLLKDEP
jgi:hypothetical protein